MAPQSKSGYRNIMRALSASGSGLPLRSMANRLLTRAELSTTPGPHMGMALDCYTNCTSPLRKHADFMVHLQIKAIIAGQSAELTKENALKALKEQLLSARTATTEAERWLAGRYLQRLSNADPERQFEGVISHVNSSGFTVRLSENGLEGFVDLRKDPEKFSYDKWTASLTSTTRRFQLEQGVTVQFRDIDRENLFLALFEVAPDCGLKPPKSS